MYEPMFSIIIPVYKVEKYLSKCLESVKNVNPYVSMEYYAYHTVHELFLYGDLTLQQWIDIFNRIRFVCDDFKRYTVQDANIRQALEEMYLTKMFCLR